jgi:hypothetical protein
MILVLYRTVNKINRVVPKVKALEEVIILLYDIW